MGRWTYALLLLLLPLCLFLQDRYGNRVEVEDEPGPEARQVPITLKPLGEAELVRQELLAGLALAPGAGFPAALPWGPLQKSARNKMFPLDYILHNDPVAFLEMTLERYAAEVKGYQLLFRKRERISGKLPPRDKEEKIEVQFREEPFSVVFKWLENPGLARRVLYVEGENNGKMLCRGTGLLAALGIIQRDVDGAEAKNSGRYTIAQFGLKFATMRTINSMLHARVRGALHVRYEGVYFVPEIGDRPCYKFVRTPYDPPEEENLFELTLYIDQETWLQVGSVLRDISGNIIGEYYFRDIRLNPEFTTSTFQRSSL